MESIPIPIHRYYVLWIPDEEGAAARVDLREKLQEAADKFSELSKRGVMGPIHMVPGGIIFGELMGFCGIQIGSQIVAPVPAPLDDGRRPRR